MDRVSYIIVFSVCWTVCIYGSDAATTSYLPFDSSDLPLLFIDTDGEDIEDEERIRVHLGVIYHADGSRHYVADTFNDYDGIISIEHRGNSSLGFPKKSYNFETQFDNGENRNVELLGLPAENDWILYAPYSDKSLMRNYLAFRLGWSLGHYNPRTRFCEVVLNGDYQGVYVLMEKIKIDANRLDISRLKPTDLTGDQLTGGYIIQVNWDGAGWTSFGKRFIYHYPQSDQLEEEQRQYIRSFITHFESVLWDDDFTNGERWYRNYLSVSSMIDFLLINELAKNVDGMRFSTFMYKDRDSRDSLLHMGPLWDYNLAFGNMAEGVFDEWEGWSRGNELDPSLFWWQRLHADQDFLYRQRARWEELRGDVLSTERILDIIDSTALYLDESQERNFERWPILGEYVWDNPYWGDTYQEDVDYMKDWISERLTWIDDNLPRGEQADPGPDPDYASNSGPNPFTDRTSISYTLSFSSRVTLEIYDIRGVSVRSVPEHRRPGGTHYAVWDGLDGSGQDVPCGVYFISVFKNGRFLNSTKVLKY